MYQWVSAWLCITLLHKQWQWGYITDFHWVQLSYYFRFFVQNKWITAVFLNSQWQLKIRYLFQDGFNVNLSPLLLHPVPSETTQKCKYMYLFIYELWCIHFINFFTVSDLWRNRLIVKYLNHILCNILLHVLNCYNVTYITKAGIILCMGPTNERRRYIMTSPLIG